VKPRSGYTWGLKFYGQQGELGWMGHNIPPRCGTRSNRATLTAMQPLWAHIRRNWKCGETQ
jgi:hypothetical protein